MSVQEDIKIAKKVINSDDTNNILFTEQSIIYKSTNENINHPDYQKHLREKESILSIIGSGDQILNSILFGTKKVDAYDISRFPKYFLELKIAAIQALSYEEYLEFFYGRNSFDRKTYQKVVDSMDSNFKEFWQSIASTSLFSKEKKPSEVYRSSLFSASGNSIEVARSLNPYLTKTNYQELKRRIKDSKIRYTTGNIYKLPIIQKYDLVNLSNICMYQRDYVIDYPEETNPQSTYKPFIKNFQLNRDGRVLNYLMGYTHNSVSYRYARKYYEDDSDFTLEIINNPSTGTLPDALLVYQKTK